MAVDNASDLWFIDKSTNYWLTSTKHIPDGKNNRHVAYYFVCTCKKYCFVVALEYFPRFSTLQVTLQSLTLLLWRHFCISSVFLFRIRLGFAIRMWYFSIRQISHFLVPHWYGTHCCTNVPCDGMVCFPLLGVPNMLRKACGRFQLVFLK